MLGFYSYNRMHKVKELTMANESLTNKLNSAAFLIDVQYFIDGVNRAVTSSQLLNEQRLRREANEAFERYKQVTANDPCANTPVPAGVADLLRG
ncbi:hypothetical protein I2494_20150 [Budviciaceae bacterium BWR-B9]|uniref:Uncharacterized protein n=1 Tax=Limnobaculum allomyrinae TaxID=2791986 RepID=A0ABS1IWB2_9GAMM|nr:MULTISPECIES: hypothetical protein [Limnobaculum]MBK5145984.1 hypothetical protein [Limnobaculum allomyrinae]MBV7694035.1 hypothetical protein [Limnobaculum sp. M2-1]